MVILGLGSNCGDRLGFLRTAIQKLKATHPSSDIDVLAISPLYESDALLPENAPESWNQPFLNLCILCKTHLDPLALLKKIKGIEEQLGRQKRERWAPREIDIDILAMGHLVFESADLKIPHPSLLNRPFALLPFADIAPDWKFPGLESNQNRTIAEDVSTWRNKPVDQIPFRTRRTSNWIPQWVGILNVTPDSFSDGGHFYSVESAVQQARHLVSQGIRILDIGAESTRPGSLVITPDEEWTRLAPVLEAVRAQTISSPSKVLLSVDTRHHQVAQQALRMGVDWINDVTGAEAPEMRKTLAESHADVVIMHSLTIPPSREATLPTNADPISLLLRWAEERIADLENSGISRERIIFDPGIGFGKTVEQTWSIFRGARRFQELGVRTLVGHSRKSFLTSVTDKLATDRDLETVTLSLDLGEKGVDFLRIHNAEMHVRSQKVWAHMNGVIRCHS
jgi:2-amino-4-hydroxy-6-hydroxymethyldihydropteridine diphosphokinase/dihydropteroate synthase